jgi:hypothetical protein
MNRPAHKLSDTSRAGPFNVIARPLTFTFRVLIRFTAVLTLVGGVLIWFSTPLILNFRPLILFPNR